MKAQSREENEIWKDIIGYEGLYQISNLGRVKSLARDWVKKERILFPSLTNKGYCRVQLFKNKVCKRETIHRLVITAFIPNPLNKREINHKNCIKTDNRIKNLEWCTTGENMKHSWANGLINRTGTPISDSIIKSVYSLRVRGFTYNEICKQLSISSASFYRIRNQKITISI